MDKHTFIREYRSLGSWKLTIFFDNNIFFADEAIALSCENIRADEALSYYVLRYCKNNQHDDRDVEEKLADTDTALVQLSEAAQDPSKWDLDLKTRTLPKEDELTPIPIATDTVTKRSLVLDSNHCLTNLINRLAPYALIPIVRVKGPGLDRLVVDFEVLNRQP